MLKEREREVLMVPPSRSENGCCTDHNVLRCGGGLDSVKKKKAVAFNNNNPQGRPRREDFDLGGGGGGVTTGGDKEDEGELEVHISSDDDGFLAPSSPGVAAFLPPVHEGVGCGGREMKNSTTDFGSSRAPAQNGFFCPNRVVELVTNENGFVGSAEKRMRNAEGLSSPSPSPSPPPLVGNHSKGKESFRMGGGGGFQDCPEAPLRKRVHVEEREKDSVDALGSSRIVQDELGEANGHVESENRKSVTGVRSPTRLDEGRTSESEERKGRGLLARVPPTPARTEGNGEGLVETREGGRGVVDGEGDVEMVPEEEEALQEDVLLDRRNNDHVSVLVGENDIPFLPDVTDMDVDVPSSSEKIEVVDGIDVVDRTDSPRAEELGDELLKAAWRINAEAAGASSPPIFGDVFEEVRRGRSSSSTDHHLGHPGSPPSPGDDERRQGTVQRDLPQARKVVEVIEFDDSDEDGALEVNGVHESDGSSTKGKKPISQHGEQRRRNGYRFSSSESTAPSFNPEEDNSDSDDCQVVGSWRPPIYRHSREGAPKPVVVEEDDDDNYTSTDQETDSSDVEEIGGSQSDIRRGWEEAAMRRRMGRAMQSAGSKANGGQGATINLEDDRTESQGLEESVATSTYRDSPDSKDQTETSEARGGPEGVVHRADVLHGTTSRVDEEERPVGRSHADDAIILNGVDESVEVNVPDMPADSPGPDQGEVYRSKFLRVEIPGVTESDRGETRSTDVRSEGRKEASSGSADQNGEERSQSKNVVLEGFETGITENQDVDVGDEAETSTAHEDLIAARENLKQTPQYRKTDEAEWASRQKEIQRQAVESKRLRQRKRQEADRKREMERKQKERIEELRLTQMKEERNMDLRDQLRGQVRTELERVAATCGDFATLLRQLGIPVEGGSHPSTQQVNAAYKKALFKFHPDRAVASSQGEPRYQVEAEEKFKLIQRLKDTLVPVAHDYNTYSGYRSFF